MSQPWTLRPPVDPAPELLALVDGHRLVAQLLAQRGFDTPEKARPFLDPEAYRPAPPTALLGLARAAELLHESIAAGKRILVWGDFDVDGQTSTATLVAGLRHLAGPERVRFHVPNRFREGHGIQVAVLAEKLADPSFRPDVLLTCDTGIAEGPAIGYAKDQGLTVIVTDHHDLPPELQSLTPGQDPLFGLPPQQVGADSVRRADAIVNPKFQPPDDPLRTLPGVGVAFKLIQALFQQAGQAGQERVFLDLVALGIVADVAEQVHDARYLLQLGLEQLRRTRRIGLLALMEVARLNPATVDAESIAFQLGPRMNAVGRLEDATVAVELLTTTDPIRAGQLAAQMERLNQQRRLLTSQITASALEIIERNPWLLDFNALVLAHPAWHAGIVGIVASRLVEEFQKPTVLLLNPPGQPARGSARSVPGVDIGAAIAACSHLLLGHGGHPGAAGLSLPPENIDRFRRELDRQVEAHRSPDVPPGLVIDAEVPLGELSMPLAEALQRLAPFGNGNPMPQWLSRQLQVVDDRRLGRDGSHRKLLVQAPDGTRQPVIWFHGADGELPAGPVDLVYTLGINEFRGERSLQLSYVASRPGQAHVPEIAVATPAAVPIHDLRSRPVQLADLPGPEQAHWYAEGVHLAHHTPEPGQAVPYAPRTAFAQDISPGAPLVLWSIPPSSALLRWLVETSQPSAIYLCGRPTTDDSVAGVLRSVAGMCKYALERDRLLDVGRMAARLGTTEAVIRHSLLWLEVRGLIQLEEWLAGDAARIRVPEGADHNGEHPEEADILRAELEEQLAEVRAYRRFFLRARVTELGLPASQTPAHPTVHRP
ncbi:DHH family phosphoesterase [Litorilinea aerophila]|uniref:Single-stranded-DNA-specific exonuclease RecJ n=1 Tax=Litorilinea aerophila TaxID=1204385 RepID=A0A540VC87_9CHLR|nr:DHH family phosphoesterase [Litorilinea aerophila]MCC9077906.1 DHH family phosphoesterase [Litorilinea aerophila]